MFIDQRIALAVRKERLLARIEAQRGQLAAYAIHLEKPFAAADKVIRAGRFIAERPWIAGLVVLALALLRRRNLLHWVGRGWALWRGWRLANRMLRQYGFIKIQ